MSVAQWIEQCGVTYIPYSDAIDAALDEGRHLGAGRQASVHAVAGTVFNGLRGDVAVKVYALEGKSAERRRSWKTYQREVRVLGALCQCGDDTFVRCFGAGMRVAEQTSSDDDGRGDDYESCQASATTSACDVLFESSQVPCGLKSAYVVLELGAHSMSDHHVRVCLKNALRVGVELKGEELQEVVLRAECLEWLAVVAMAMRNMFEQCGVLHRDLTLSNVVLVRSEADHRDAEWASFVASLPSATTLRLPYLGLVPRIVDFGCSVLVSLPEKVSRGSLRHYPPESIEDFTFTHESDIWCFGCLVWEVAHHKQLFEESNTADAIKRVTRGQMPACDASVLGGVRCVVEGCWTVDPRERMPLADCARALRSEAQMWRARAREMAQVDLAHQRGDATRARESG